MSKPSTRRAVRTARLARVRAPSAIIASEIRAEWQRHFGDAYGANSRSVENAMLTVMLLTGSEFISAGELAARLHATYPDVTQALTRNAEALAEAFRGQGE